MKKINVHSGLAALSLSALLCSPAQATLSTIDITNSYDGGDYTVQMTFNLDDAYRLAFPSGWQLSPGSLDPYISNFIYSIGGTLGSSISLTSLVFGLNAPDGQWDGGGFDDFVLEGFWNGNEVIFDRFNVNCSTCSPAINPNLDINADGNPTITITPVNPVAEPASLGLLGLGLVALGFQRRKQSRLIT